MKKTCQGRLALQFEILQQAQNDLKKNYTGLKSFIKKSWQILDQSRL